jgi:regulator of sigma E protease
MGTSIIAFIVVLGVLIFFHELGHFIVARLFGVGVEKFSLGFGPKLLGKKYGITDYRLSAVPLGGYVKMVGEEPDADLDPADIQISFTHKSVWKRILIVAAGPVFNILLAVIIFFGFFLIAGIEDVTPVIRKIDVGGAAQKAGLRKDDLILSIDNTPVESWYDIIKAVEGSKGQTLFLKARQGNSVIEAEVLPELRTGKNLFGDEVAYYDLGISGFPELEAIVGGVSEGFPAQKAGLKRGDRIVALDGQKIESWSEMQKIISESRGQALLATVRREKALFDVEMTPVLKKRKNALGKKEDRYLIGISTAAVILPDEDKFIKRLNSVAAFIKSIERAYFVAEISVVGLVKIITRSISSDNLGGPILIAHMAGEQAKEGLDKLIQFIAIISINLAIINFLPIPVLDGGHLLFFFIEAVIGRPVNIRMREIAQQVGIFVLILLMVYVFYNDITRFFFS